MGNYNILEQQDCELISMESLVSTVIISYGMYGKIHKMVVLLLQGKRNGTRNQLKKFRS